MSWVEETLKTAALRDAARILGKFYTEILPGVLGVDYPDGGHGTRTRTVLSTVGPVEITRAYVVNGDGERSFPLDDAMGLVGGCTPAAAGMACWAGAQSASYDLAGAALTRLAGLAMVEGIESAEDWSAYRQAMLASFAPVGMLEETLAERSILTAWRMRRVSGYRATASWY